MYCIEKKKHTQHKCEWSGNCNFPIQLTSLIAQHVLLNMCVADIKDIKKTRLVNNMRCFSHDCFSQRFFFQCIDNAWYMLSNNEWNTIDFLVIMLFRMCWFPGIEKQNMETMIYGE